MLSIYAFAKPFAKPADYDFPRQEVLRLAKQQVRCLMTTRRTTFKRLTSDLFMHVFTRASFPRSGANSLRAVLRWFSMNKLAWLTTRLVWTAMILNSSKTSGPLSNGRTL